MRTLDDFRRRIDVIDEQLVQLLAKRLDVCREVASYKKRHRIPMMQPERVAMVKRRAAERGAPHGLAPIFIETLYGVIIGEACRVEDEIIVDETVDATGKP